MNASDYQTKAARTMNGLDVRLDDEQLRLLNYALGIAGEAGEIAELVKKASFHGKGFDLPALMDEMGDLLWYCAAVCTLFNIDMGRVMERNVAKLEARYPVGFQLGGGNRE